ncbi:hypothetical protein R1flu_018060 [Riccia fluitans]|uniref:Glutathione S-transferase n=1 Tax=Riccia fluitans TaxID=41844 RepID=A0ABD1ZEZ4_9MARC
MLSLIPRASNIPHELVVLNLVEKEHTRPEYKEMNPTCQVPFINDDGFVLPESTAILRYLAASHHLADHWYPTDVKARARIDYLLDWYHTNIYHTSVYVMERELRPHLWKAERDDSKVKSSEEKMIAAMNLVEEFFLKPEGPFLLGASQPSIADVVFACEYTQTLFLPKAEEEKLLSERPKTKKWLEVMELSLTPHYTEAHKTLPDLIKMVEAVRSVKTL